MQLTHVRLLVSDFDGCFRFYRDVLKLPVNLGSEGDVYAEFRPSSGSIMALFRQDLMTVAVGTTQLATGSATQDQVALTFEVENVDASVDQLRARGVQFITEPQDRPDWMIRTAHFRDPEGNLIELYSPLEIHQPAASAQVVA